MVAVKSNSPIALLKADEKVSKIEVPISFASSTNVFHSISKKSYKNRPVLFKNVENIALSKKK